MKLREFIEYLQILPNQEHEVYVVGHRDGYGLYDQGGNASVVLFDPNEHVEYDCYGTVLFGAYRS